MRLKTASVGSVAILVLCLLAFPVIRYAGGRACMPLNIAMMPAQIVPFGIGFIGVLVLVIGVSASLIKRRERAWTLGALAIAIAAMAIYVSCAGRLPGFLHGLRDRFVGRVGYPKMREFAKEVSAGTPLTTEDGVIQRPGRFVSQPASDADKKAWDDLASRYPFLNWTYGAGTVLVRGGIVELTWGSALTGHWGFHVSPEGTVKDLRDREDRGTSLRAAEDIQFVYYWD